MTLTNIADVRKLMVIAESSYSAVRVEGVVLWISPSRDRFILEDASAGISVKMDLSQRPVIQPGQGVLLEAGCMIGHGEAVVEPLVENDGLHSRHEKSETAYLSAGLHPITVEWFNGPAEYALNASWEGPGLARQQIPKSSLLRKIPALSKQFSLFGPGLDFRCYHGDWTQLPDLAELPFTKSGSVPDFDLQVADRSTNVALVFSGYLNVPRDGNYTIWLDSDDGSLFYFGNGPPKLVVQGGRTWPTPERILPESFVAEKQDCVWAESEGVVKGISEGRGCTILELTSGSGHFYAKLLDEGCGPLKALLQSTVKVRGICQVANTMDRQPVPSFLVTRWQDIQIEKAAPMFSAEWQLVRIGTLPEKFLQDQRPLAVCVSGTIGKTSSTGVLTLQDPSGLVPFESQGPPPREGERIEALAWCCKTDGQMRLTGAFWRESSPPIDGQALPLLTEAIQVKSLSRNEAQRGYPVRIQGVITAGTNDYFLQDSTGSIYVLWDSSASRQAPRIGEYWEIEGKSCVEFAPNIRASHAVYLGPGILPEPIRPIQAELLNGSLDTKYIELRGVATAVDGAELTLLTQEGKVKLVLRDLSPPIDKGTVGSLARIRGITVPERDKNQMVLPLFQLVNASVIVDEPAPVEPFDIPRKAESDLLFFDAHADTLRRVKLAGQVVYAGEGECFCMDGTNGFRFQANDVTHLKAGDMVEIAGFPDISGPSPVLREAIMRQTGVTNLPPATSLWESTILSGKWDATLVRLDSHLVDYSVGRSEQVLELQIGNRGYVAHLRNSRGLLSGMLPGSELELTGVYSAKGGNRALNRDIDSFELLLNSSADVRILARPSWWTVRHTIAVIASMVLVIIVAVAWIAILRHQVEERSRQLSFEIKAREQAEHRHAMEEERSRIARDLHDDLGATLTEIRFLSAIQSSDALVPEATRLQLSEVSEKSRQLVSSLDEIVWAVNPENDHLPNLASYLRHAAEEFFRNTPGRCRLDIDEKLPPIPLTSEIRHNLYLCAREGLNNIAKHASASEAWLRIHWVDQTLWMTIEDNGCGFTDATAGNGLSNMRQRLESIGGCFELETRTGFGTSCRIRLPFPEMSYAN